ncbi:MAG: aldo/keto reductase [Vicinamibacterales bacterium]
MPTSHSSDPILRRPFGRYSDLVSIIGIGGYHLGKIRTITEAVRIVHEAVDAGVNFLDNAWEYHEGESERRMGRAIRDRRDSVFLMTKVCTHGRDGKVAMRQGKVRYVGFTGHKDPDLHLRMLSFGFPFDACQLPLNGFDAAFRSFQDRLLPELARQKVAAIGMKSLGGDGRAVKRRTVGVAEALRYAMSLPVCTTVSGIDSLKVLRQNVRIARAFTPMNAHERRAYEKRLSDCATDGRFELYKTTAEHEGDVGRRQHGYPSQNELAL